jgi:hypothetical protein
MHSVSVSAETDAHTSREGTHFRNPFKDTFVSVLLMSPVAVGFQNATTAY